MNKYVLIYIRSIAVKISFEFYLINIYIIAFSLSTNTNGRNFTIAGSKSQHNKNIII